MKIENFRNNPSAVLLSISLKKKKFQIVLVGAQRCFTKLAVLLRRFGLAGQHSPFNFEDRPLGTETFLLIFPTAVHCYRLVNCLRNNLDSYNKKNFNQFFQEMKILTKILRDSGFPITVFSSGFMIRPKFRGTFCRIELCKNLNFQNII